MKKVKFFGLAGIILLASGAGFSSCSSDSADPTGGTGVAGQVVKTQFAINIPYGNNSSANQAKKVTRMTGCYHSAEWQAFPWYFRHSFADL